MAVLAVRAELDFRADIAADKAGHRHQVPRVHRAAGIVTLYIVRALAARAAVMWHLEQKAGAEGPAVQDL